MKFFNKLERKFGKYAIPNLTRYIIITYGIGYLLWFIQQASSVNILGWLTLDPGLILQGQGEFLSSGGLFFTHAVVLHMIFSL